MKTILKAALPVAFSALFCSIATAQTPCPRHEMQGTGNPYLPLWEHLPDGEPRVFEDPDRPGHWRAYIIGSHDLSLNQYCGADIRMWSAPVDNLLRWRDEGPIFTYRIDGRSDIMYAPDLVEVEEEGQKVYYLYPHSRGHRREAMVCRSNRPDGPFTPINLRADGRATLPGSIMGFDPSVYVEPVTDTRDPDHAKGFRAYGFWGFQRSLAAELNPETMYSVRPGKQVIPDFIPAGEEEFGFFEASSIRKVGNKYVMIYSGFSGKEYGLYNSNSTLRYAYGDTPLGPWKSGGVLVDSRAVVPNREGTHLTTTNAGHNTHGSLQQIGNQWYVFYHRPPRGFGFARQAMVEAVTIRWDKKSVARGGRVEICGLNTYKTTDGHQYTGAEVTSEGFQIFGLPPYKYYSAGLACYLSNGQAMQDNWDVWDNNMPVLMTGSDIVGFKHFGFGGLKQDKHGIPAFEGTQRGNDTHLNLFLTPLDNEPHTLHVMLDGPWNNETWKGKEIAAIQVPADKKGELLTLTADVSQAVDGLHGKHAVYLLLDGQRSSWQLNLRGLAFTHGSEPMQCPQPPVLNIRVDGKNITLPSLPTRFTPTNGLTDNAHYTVHLPLTPHHPRVEASCPDSCVNIELEDKYNAHRQVEVHASLHGITKTYTVCFE